MNRPRWFPPLRYDTPDHQAQAIRACQGDWWRFGGSVCRKPDLCVAARACYFVEAMAAVPDLPAIVWLPGDDLIPEPWFPPEAA